MRWALIKVRQLGLEGVLEIRTERFSDDRGVFSETWSQRDFAAAGLELTFVQDNHSLSRRAGVLRGLHFQTPPFGQDKLVRVSRGSIFDVAVDIRNASPTFGQWTSAILSAAEWNQLLVPTGFAHGFVALEPDTEVQYKVTAPYSREHDRSVRFDDPAIGIEWPFDHAQLILSEKDLAAPLLAEIETGF
jgi:dTDP-4-dehydrorhamnose 3,5-epimerase